MADGRRSRSAMDTLTELDARLGSSAFPADPYPVFAELRRTAPVHWSDAWGFWVVTRYADVTAILRDPRRFSNVGRSAPVERVPDEQRKRLAPMFASFRVGMPSTDPPVHTRLRSLVNKVVTPSRVEAMRPRIQQLFDELLDERLDEGRMDLIEGIAYPFPATVVAELVGLPVSDRARFKGWSSDMIALHSTGRPDPAAAETAWVAWQAARDWLDGLIAERRARPQDDILSLLVHATIEGDSLSDIEILSTLVTLMTAGHETTTGLIGNGVLALIEHPEQMERLRAEPELIGTAVDEVLRFESPFPRAWRRTAEAVELSGVEIPADAIVSASLASANRDPEQFPDADRFDIGRQPNRHVGLGGGIHFCLGAPLAKLEGVVALGTLARRLPSLELDGEPVWQPSITHHVMRSMPVRW
jgi:cytochrome P450